MVVEARCAAESARRAPAAFGRRGRRRLTGPGGFSIVELLVVMGIISVILAIGLPAFNSMTTQSRFAKARQLLNGSMTRANVLAISDRSLVAVRIVPVAWEVDDKTGSASALETSGQQMVTTYRYVTAVESPADPSAVVYQERFERVKGMQNTLLPTDTWAAPAEAILPITADRDGDGTSGTAGDAALDELRGTVGRFLIDADPRSNGNNNEEFLSADDFLVVFSPDSGVVSSVRRPSWRMSAYDPYERREQAGRFGNGNWDGRQYLVGFRRFNYTGVLLYQREPFVGLGRPGATAPQVNARRDYLQRFANQGLLYHVSRSGGSLSEGQ